jgi:hypothetical protein
MCFDCVSSVREAAGCDSGLAWWGILCCLDGVSSLASSPSFRLITSSYRDNYSVYFLLSRFLTCFLSLSFSLSLLPPSLSRAGLHNMSLDSDFTLPNNIPNNYKQDRRDVLKGRGWVKPVQTDYLELSLGVCEKAIGRWSFVVVSCVGVLVFCVGVVLCCVLLCCCVLWWGLCVVL